MKFINGKAYRKTEPHMHVAPVSVCSRLDANAAAEKFAACGFDTVIITNHYSRSYIEVHHVQEQAWRELFIENYHVFQAAAAKYGMEVLLGAEVTLYAWYNEYYKGMYSEETFKENFADYLVYGITEEFIRTTPMLCDLTLPELSKICHDHGALLLQAHPFRTEQQHSLKDLRFLDGIEMNANEGFPSGPHEEEVLRLARENGLVLTCGGDTHCPWTHLTSAMYIPEEIHDSVAFAKYLKEVKIPYYSLDEPDDFTKPREYYEE